MKKFFLPTKLKIHIFFFDLAVFLFNMYNDLLCRNISTVKAIYKYIILENILSHQLRDHK